MKNFLDHLYDIMFLCLCMIFFNHFVDSISDTTELLPHGNPPQIILGSDEIIRKNEQIIISCEADKPLFWSYPKLENEHRFESRVEIQNIHKGIYRTNLIVYNASYADTGFYRCLYNNSTDDNDGTSSASKYIYVYDPDHLLVFWESSVYNVFELNTSTLSWCRPTSPNIIVDIEYDEKTIMHSKHVSYPFSYDPRFGFTVANIYTNIAEGVYVCKATDFSHQNIRHVHVKLTAPPMILIKTDKEFYKPNEQMYIECHISTNSDAFGQLQMEWGDNKIESDYIKSNRVLSYNTTAKQSGKISCMSENKYGKRLKTLMLYVTDLDKSCDVWSSIDSTNVNINEQLILECGATMQKYSNNIQWYFNNSLVNTNQQSIDDDEIVNYDTNYSHRSKLIIVDIDYANGGNYECRVENETESCGRIDVSVEGKPSLSCPNFDENTLYEYYQVIQLNCLVESNPLPLNVECYFESTDYTDKISTTFSKFDRMTVTFDLTLTLYESGKIHCNATNRIGTNDISLDVYIKQSHFLISYTDERNITIHVNSVIIPCRPTSSDVVIKLMQKSTQIANSINTSSPFTYDSNVGFIVQDPYANLNSTQYDCVPEYKGKVYSDETLTFKISGEPRVQIENESYKFEYSTSITVKCIVSSFIPIERIDWYYIKNNSTIIFTESSYTKSACNANTALCTETVLNMTVNESGALRCEARSGSNKYSSTYDFSVTNQRGTVYNSPIYIALIVILAMIVFVIIFIRKRIRRKNRNRSVGEENVYFRNTETEHLSIVMN